MLHLHFGAGRLGLGLIAPFFRTGDSQLHILNRATSGAKPTGSTALSSERRNELLRDHPEKHYVIAPPGNKGPAPEQVRYDGFTTYDDDSAASVVRAIVESSPACKTCVLVTASVLKAENYRPILGALDLLASMREQGELGPLFLVACENTIGAHEVLADPGHADAVSERVRREVVCVHALVDRMCVGLEEYRSGPFPTVLVRAEEYGSVKLELSDETGELQRILQGSRVEWSRHVATEKQIKSWLLNGSHWLIALAAFQETKGNRELTLNEYLRARPERENFAREVMTEMREGVGAILRHEPEFAEFVRDVDPDRYLEGAAEAILDRFLETEDPITRILARFKAPSPEALTTIDAFSKRFADRVDGPIIAYEAERGIPPAAATHSVQSLVRLLASGTFIDARRG